MPEEQVTVSERVVQQVAATTGQDPLQLPVLQDAIDADALDTLTTAMPNGQVSFNYADQEITVTSDGEITLEDPLVREPAIEPGTTDDGGNPARMSSD